MQYLVGTFRESKQCYEMAFLYRMLYLLHRRVWIPKMLTKEAFNGYFLDSNGNYNFAVK